MADLSIPAPPPLNTAKVRGLIFDLDGTLVDSYAAIAASLNHARAGFGLAALPDETIRRGVGRGLESLIADLVGEERVERGVRLFRERYATVYREGTFALPGADETLRELRRRGYRVTVASNKPARFSEPILRAVGLFGYVDAVQGPDVAGTTKPEPTMLRNCLARMGIGADAGLYVGDMVLDVETAARAGVPVVLVCGGSSRAAELRATGQPVVEGLEELARLL
jgi:phosphoglycolate phosphatase